MAEFRVALVSTGGTIEKTYQPHSGELRNETSVLEHMLAKLRLPEVRIDRISLMNKDSLDMTAEDHLLIAQRAHQAAETADGVIVVHGTDRMAESGDATWRLGVPSGPIIFTGAMRPYELRNTDALQNLIEALTAVRLVDPGVYAVMHNKVLAFPGVIKDVAAGTFVKTSSV